MKAKLSFVIVCFLLLVGVYSYFRSLVYSKSVKYYKESRRSYNNGDYKAALENVDKAIEIFNSHTLFHLSKGIYYERQLNIRTDDILNNSVVIEDEELLQNAIKEHLIARSLNKNDDLIFYNLGWLHWYNNNVDSSLYYFKKAIDIEPNESLYFVSAGLVYEWLNKISLAFQYYDKAIVASPDILDSRFYLELRKRFPTQTYYQGQRVENQLSQRIIISNDIIEKAKLGKLYSHIGKLDSAYKSLKAVVAEMPNLGRAWYNLGVVSMTLNNDDDDVLQYFLKSSFLDGNDPLPMLGIANFYLRRGNIILAKSYFRKAYFNRKAINAFASKKRARFYKDDFRIYQDIIPVDLISYCRPILDFDKAQLNEMEMMLMN